MAAELRFYQDPDHTQLFEAVHLTDVQITDDIGMGAPVPIYAVNMGTTTLRDLTVGLSGDGAQYVQLAADLDDQPGVWADRGQSIMASSGNLPVANTFKFWARGVYTLTDLEGNHDFNFVIDGTSIG